MDETQIISIIVLGFLLILSACFSSVETAYSSVNMIRVKQMVKNGNKKAKIAYNNAKNFTMLITTVLIGNNIANILATSIATSLFIALFGANGVAIATFMMTVLILIFGEITPKIIAKQNPETISLLAAKPLKYLMIFFKPLTSLVVKIENIFDKDDNVTATEDELLEIVTTIETEGVLEQEERELIESAIEFDDKTVRDIMVPKDDVVFIYDTTTYEELKIIMNKYKLSRFPVISYKTLQAVGVLRVRDVLDNLLTDKPIVVKDLMQKPIYVSQRRKLYHILHNIQKSRSHMAIVVENIKSHNFVGIVTLEDVLEELVGEIYDEYDPLPTHVVEIGQHTFDVEGHVMISDFFDNYIDDQEPPVTKALTIGAWVSELNEGRKVRKNRELEFENFTIKVLETKDGIATKVEIDVASYIDEQE
ncbi:MAG: hemolysin family protein [Erysipelotrichaceae bacterium]